MTRPVTPEYACWLRGAAQAFIAEGYDPGRLAVLSADDEVGHFFAEILAEVRRLQEQAS